MLSYETFDPAPYNCSIRDEFCFPYVSHRAEREQNLYLCKVFYVLSI